MLPTAKISYFFPVRPQQHWCFGDRVLNSPFPSFRHPRVGSCLRSNIPKHLQLLGLVAVLSILGSPQLLLAHGPVHERLLVLDARIAAATNDSALYVQRAELHREHQDWTSALADLDRAQQLDARLVRADFCRARLFNDMGEFLKARVCLNQLLLVATNDTEALVLRARTLINLGVPAEAVADFSRAIVLMREPPPELFLERTDLLAAAGQTDEALRGLDEGVKRLGALIVFESRALDLELSRTNYDGALLRLQAIVDASPRKESWLARRGDLLRQAGRIPEAKQSWTEAVKAVDALPDRVRESDEMVKLRARLRDELEQADKSPFRQAPAR